MHRRNYNRHRHRRGIMIFVVTVLAGCVCATGGCSKKVADDSPHFHLKGRVVTVNPAEKTITVDHEAIPGLMGAMEMPYPAGEPKDLRRVAPGDEITADIVMEQGVPLLENIVVAKKAADEKVLAKP